MNQLRIPFELVLGDGRTSFGIDNVVCEYDDRQFELPSDLAGQAGQLVEDLQQKLGFELTNEPAYRLLGAQVDTGGDGQDPTLSLRFERTNYFDFAATNLSLDRRVLDDGQSTIRTKHVKDIARFEETPLANSLSVMILLLSEPDGKLLLARRGDQVAVDQGRLQVSTGGAMRLAVDHDENLRPSPFIAGQRELAEEIGLRLSLEDVRMLGLGVDTRTGEPELLGFATTHLSVKEIQQAFRTARHGSEELTGLEFVPFSIDALAPFLVDEAWCPGDWACCYLALVHQFGEEAVQKRIRWQTIYGLELAISGDGDGRDGGMAADGGGIWERLRPWRKKAPLGLRQAYGWARRRVVPHYLWAHPEFERYRHWLIETEKLSRTELEEMQLERLQGLLEHAYENVPYYRKVLNERGLRPADFCSLDDLAKLPVLTREEVRKHLPEMIARNVDSSKLYYVMTGGTTGVPLGFYHEKDVSQPHEGAFMYRQWRWAGYRLGDPVALLRPYAFTHRVENGNQAWWDYDAYDNSIQLSNYLMSRRTLPQYLDMLRKFKPKFVQSFPSALYVMSRYMLELGIGDIRPQAIFTEFEQLYPAQRALIEEAFGCPVLAGYGHSERAVDAVECLERSGYHVCMEYGVLELTDEEGQPVPPGEVGFVTGTGLDTHCMPFIRYQTDDVARFAPEPCACGRAFPLITDIVGRWQHEVVVTRDERYIPVTTLNTHNDAFRHVEQYQYFQEKPGELVLRMVPLPAYSEADTRGIQDALLTKLHGEMEIQIAFVPEIAKTRRGKHRMLIQELPVSLENYYEEGGNGS